ncbi:hypothetical protein ACFL5H_02815 [Candidatus Latescibacterota bacterium]
MSKYNDIQNALLQVDQITFERIVNSYLFNIGYKEIYSIGVTKGKNRTKKGRPDSFIRLSNGKFLYVESTVQEKYLFRKLMSDLHECLNVKKTEIPIEKIEKVVLAFTGKLKPGEIDKLQEFCINKCTLELIGIDKLSLALFFDYPRIAKEFLGIELDTGQILTENDFIKDFEKGKFSTPLRNIFINRATEIQNVTDSLESNNIVIISGAPGTGKTKIAIESTRSFCESHQEYARYFILYKGNPIYEDLKNITATKVLIIIDDANRISSLDSILWDVYKGSDERIIKIVLTVRDYAVKSIIDKIKSYKYWDLISIDKLSNKEIENILKSDDFKIKNQDYLDRICSIAQGNPRLAIMAGLLAIKNNDLRTLNDVSDLYNEYFDDIVKKLEQQEITLVKVLGIISYLRLLRNDEEKIYHCIHNIFGISKQEIWDNFIKLEKIELVDIYENRIVKISDQVLPTFFFYKVFIKDKILQFSDLLNNLYFGYEGKMREAIIPVINNLGYNRITEEIGSDIKQKWNSIKNDDAYDQYGFIDNFWPFISTEVLLFIKKQIENMKQDFYEIDFESIPKDITDKILISLAHFKADCSNFQTSLDLAFQYLSNNSKIYPQILKYVTEELSFKPKDHLVDYYFQTTTWNYLIKEAQKLDKQKLFNRIIIDVAPYYLKTFFHFSKMESKRTFTYGHFQINDSETIKLLRKKIWEYLFTLFEIDANSIINILKKYIDNNRHPINRNKSILKYDCSLLLPFIFQKLDRNNFHQILFVQEYASFLEEYEICVEKVEVLKEQFRNNQYEIYELLEMNLFNTSPRMSHADFEVYKKTKIHEHFKNYNYKDYQLFTEICDQVFSSTDNYVFTNSIYLVLVDLICKDKTHFLKLLEFNFEKNNPLKIRNSRGLLNNYFLTIEYHDNLFNILIDKAGNTKNEWLISFFEFLPEELVDKIYYDELVSFIASLETGENEEVTIYSDFLGKFRKQDENIYQLLLMLFNKTRDDGCKINFFFLFYCDCDIKEKFDEIFNNNVELLFDIYLYQEELDKHADFNGKVFKYILEKDINFILKYLDKTIGDKFYLSKHNIEKDFLFIWQMENFKEIMDLILHYFVSRNNLYLKDILSVYFDPNDPTIQSKMFLYIDEYIKRNSKNESSLNIIFGVISNSFPEKRKEYLVKILELNKEIKFFSELPFEASIITCSGSMIPYYERCISFWQSLLPIFVTSCYLEHKKFVEDRIEGYKKTIENEKIREYMEDY